MTSGVQWVKKDAEKALDRLSTSIDASPYSSLVEVATAFRGGIAEINRAHDLPTLAIAFCIVHHEVLGEGLGILAEGVKKMDAPETDPEEAVQNLWPRVLERWPDFGENVRANVGLLHKPGGSVWPHMVLTTILGQDETVERAYFSLFYSSVVRTWSVFEVAAGDLWETVLNVGFGQLGHGFLTRLGKTGGPWEGSAGKAGKSIPLSALAIVDYDIRNRLGPLMRSSKDFGSLAGIRKAYADLFPRNTTISQHLEKPEMRRFAETRNLIVHRGSKVDRQYRTSCGSTLEVGAKVRIDIRDWDEFAAVGVATFHAMFNCACAYLGREAAEAPVAKAKD